VTREKDKIQILKELKEEKRDKGKGKGKRDGECIYQAVLALKL
jgi:hypothetical protein